MEPPSPRFLGCSSCLLRSSPPSPQSCQTAQTEKKKRSIERRGTGRGLRITELQSICSRKTCSWKASGFLQICQDSSSMEQLSRCSFWKIQLRLRCFRWRLQTGWARGISHRAIPGERGEKRVPYTRDHTFSDWLLTNEGTVEILNEDSNIEISCFFCCLNIEIS